MMQNKFITINSALLFTIATLLQMTIHEGGHFITAILMQSKEIILYHNYVRNTPLSINREVVIASAGPLISLGIGMLFHLLCALQKKRNILFLFMLYMCSFGYICFFGYIMIAPFFVNGDTGYIFQQLSFPLWLTIIIAIIGVLIYIYVLKKISHFFIEMGTADIITDLSLRRPFANTLVKYPLYIGIVITTLLNLPITVFISLLYPLCSPLALLWLYGYLLEEKYSSENSNKEFEKLNKLQPILIVALVAIVIMNRLLVSGLHYN